jgi:polysaccharide pyruvyl transferase WcaK-like protein
MKTYIIISGLSLDDNNRGTAALGYGSFYFLNQKERLFDYKIIQIKFVRNFWKYRKKKSLVQNIKINEKIFDVETVHIFFLYYWYITLFKIKIPFGRLNEILRRTEYIAAINGGDGFSDIYGTKTFKSRLIDSNLAMVYKIPLIQLPQTIGPFSQPSNYRLAEKILKYSSTIYVRDLSFKHELDKMGLGYELCKDLSYFMKPAKVNDLEILPHSVGINVSGLAYSNQFRALSNKFDNYPLLIDKIIHMFQEKKIPVYLVSHSYNYSNPETNNDDLEANKAVYNSLNNKKGIYIIDRNLTSPEIKYIISRFDFFIGTRMHACFAAIYTKTPVFGLAYSYKFKGAFNEYGLKNNYADIIDLKEKNISGLLSKIELSYNQRDKVINTI